ncbi:hypothetical protein BDA96_08G017900 [Sorghum bicolor]|uniref:Secreted protein n=2 Tax=Sorghum bicolor TaxID=4558 RepID=A0A921QDN5_SORBI|nr:hypothetical protein BDA96_08G017900 [Sorghum bicolor]OQU78640.1 hypothetical protein SORBI_3008G016250 [Sorghum bicolor]
MGEGRGSNPVACAFFLLDVTFCMAWSSMRSNWGRRPRRPFACRRPKGKGSAVHRNSSKATTSFFAKLERKSRTSFNPGMEGVYGKRRHYALFISVFEIEFRNVVLWRDTNLMFIYLVKCPYYDLTNHERHLSAHTRLA